MCKNNYLRFGLTISLKDSRKNQVFDSEELAGKETLVSVGENDMENQPEFVPLGVDLPQVYFLSPSDLSPYGR